MCAEVRVGDGGSAVSIAETPSSRGSVAPLLVFWRQCARDMAHTLIDEGENTGTANVGTTDSVAAGAGRLCTDVSTKVEVIIMRAGSITGFPLLQADLPAHVDSLILCAEVRAGDGGSAVIIAEASICHDTRTVHLCSAH